MYPKDYVRGYGHGFLTMEAEKSPTEEYMAGYKMGGAEYMAHKNAIYLATLKDYENGIKQSYVDGFRQGLADVTAARPQRRPTREPHFDSGYLDGFGSVEAKHVTHKELVDHMRNSEKSVISDAFDNFNNEGAHSSKRRKKDGSNGGKSKKNKSNKNKSKKNKRRN